MAEYLSDMSWAPKRGNGYRMVQVQVSTRATTYKPFKIVLDTLTHLNLKYPWEKCFMSLQPRKLRHKEKIK